MILSTAMCMLPIADTVESGACGVMSSVCSSPIISLTAVVYSASASASSVECHKNNYTCVKVQRAENTLERTRMRARVHKCHN